MNDAILKIRCTEHTARKTKALAAECGMSLGELLKAFVFMTKTTKELSIGQLAQAHMAASSIPESGWTGDDVEAHRRYLTRVMHAATPAPVAMPTGDPRCARHFEVRAGQVGERHEIDEVALKELIFRHDQERRAYGLPPIFGDGEPMTPEAIATLDSTPERIATLREEA